MLDAERNRNPRNYFIFGILFNTGLRSAELLSLTYESLHINERTVTVVGKGRKVRSIPLNDRAMDCINVYMKYLKVKGKTINLSDKIFNITYYQLRTIMKNFCKQYGIDCTSLHITRKSFATNIISNISNITQLEKVKELMGHSNLKILEEHYLSTDTKNAFGLNKEESELVGLLDKKKKTEEKSQSSNVVNFSSYMDRKAQ